LKKPLYIGNILNAVSCSEENLPAAHAPATRSARQTRSRFPTGMTNQKSNGEFGRDGDGNRRSLHFGRDDKVEAPGFAFLSVIPVGGGGNYDVH
jgi:hypothetical protein